MSNVKDPKNRDEWFLIVNKDLVPQEDVDIANDATWM